MGLPEEFQVESRGGIQLLRKVPGDAARVSGQSGLMRRREKGKASAGTSLPEKTLSICDIALRAFCNSSIRQFFGHCASLQALRGHCPYVHQVNGSPGHNNIIGGNKSPSSPLPSFRNAFASTLQTLFYKQ